MAQIWPQHLKTAGHKLARVELRLTLSERLNALCVNIIYNVRIFKAFKAFYDNSKGQIFQLLKRHGVTT